MCFCLLARPSGRFAWLSFAKPSTDCANCPAIALSAPNTPLPLLPAVALLAMDPEEAEDPGAVAHRPAASALEAGEEEVEAIGAEVSGPESPRAAAGATVPGRTPDWGHRRREWAAAATFRSCHGGTPAVGWGLTLVSLGNEGSMLGKAPGAPCPSTFAGLTMIGEMFGKPRSSTAT